MPAFSSSAPGKVIILGEHAVVYGRPAIAVPVHQIKANATVWGDITAPQGQVQIQAPDIGLDSKLTKLPSNNPLAYAIRCVLSELAVDRPPSCIVRVSSTIPIAAGLGSGAAISVVIIRALSAFLGHPLPQEKVSKIAFEVDKIHHGTPSGIDNTVITYDQPVYYVKGKQATTFKPGQPFTLIVADTGIPSPTSKTVRRLRQAWKTDQKHHEEMFNEIGNMVKSARKAIEAGEINILGKLMNENHQLLRKMGISSPELDNLVETAIRSGALGAKLSGGGRGGNMVALADPKQVDKISNDLLEAGAVNTFVTKVGI
ncbi:MAG: mevalonate kinase [Anaerolineales bacterium]|jgi:mevalonate kinase